MELESLPFHYNGLGFFDNVQDTRLLGGWYVPQKFQGTDFNSNDLLHTLKTYSEVSSLGSKDFLKSFNEKLDCEKHETMTSNFNGNEDLFGWSNEFKIDSEKFCEDDKNPKKDKNESKSFDFTYSSEISGNKRKIWELGDLNKELESQDSQGSKKLKNMPASNDSSHYVKNDEAGGSKMPPWQVDVIEDMAADLDGSLSNLGADLAAGSYNMSEALLSLPSLTVFKQEAPSSPQENLVSQTNIQQNIEDIQEQSSTLHRLLQQNNFQNHLKRSNSNKSTDNPEKKNEDCRFQYVLAAATSIATKVTEETLTYLNQGQSYEIKLKKVGELSNFRGKILRSIIRICFHERRLQYMEKEQILAWQASRPGERIIELDVPLSYGLFDVEQDPNMLNMLSFLWDPTKEVGAYIKVNCISTEFTPKKHGGEKGVPFRIQVETFIEGESTRLHAAACQIKVFKLKGADRKHKQDREKILKRPLSEQDKYQPSYECTVLCDLLPEAVFPTPASNVPSPTSTTPVKTNTNYNVVEAVSDTSLIPSEISNSQTFQLSTDSNSQQTAQWLRENGFGGYVSTFVNFNGADILRLTRDDLIQICGLADGIRLLNALHSKGRLTIYICFSNSAIYHALYLNHIGINEMSRKLAALLGVHHNQIHNIFLQGPNNIRVLITDEVVSNIKDESMFSVEVLKDESRARLFLLLKPTAPKT